jgi:arylsulfatase A-like enzyme
VVALITVDTWRYDHFSAERSPHLWALGLEGERYTSAWSPIGLTTPAHLTMLTGLQPWEHGVEANNHHGYRLAEGVPLYTEGLEAWATGAFVSAWPAGPEGGLRRAFSTWSAPTEGERPGEVAVREALAWLPRDRPAFLWVHVYEPHGPYQGSGKDDLTRYAEEVARADAALEPLLEELVRRRARLVVAADHGEVLFEETCGRQHERSVHEVVHHVPLLRWEPGRAAAVIDRRLSLADVPALLRGEDPPAREEIYGESGICEPGCAPGCAPAGLMGRDRVARVPGGRLILRPGRGYISEGQIPMGLAGRLGALPPVQPPGSPADPAALEALGYSLPSTPEPP